MMDWVWGVREGEFEDGWSNWRLWLGCFLKWGRPWKSWAGEFGKLGSGYLNRQWMSLELWSYWSHQDIRVSKAMNLDEVHWGISVGKEERSGLRTEFWDTPRLRGQEDEEDTASLRRTREGGRKWCPGSQVRMFQEGVRQEWINISGLALLWPQQELSWQGMGMQRWLNWFKEKEQRRVETALQGVLLWKGIEKWMGAGEGCGDWNQGRVLYFWVTIRDLPACFKLLFALLWCETWKEISPLLVFHFSRKHCLSDFSSQCYSL